MNMDVQEYLNELVAKARTAQEAFAKLWFWGIRMEIWGAMRVGDWLKMPGAVTKKQL